MTCWRDAERSERWVCTGVGGVCECACERESHIRHTEGLWQ